MTIINIIIMKTFERLRELPKCDTETQSERTLMEKGANRLIWHRVATNLQFGKNMVAGKRNEVCLYLFSEEAAHTFTYPTPLHP